MSFLIIDTNKALQNSKFTSEGFTNKGKYYSIYDTVLSPMINEETMLF